MPIILGINAFHADTAACLVVDGALQMAVAEERLGKREKHCPSFPALAVRRVLHDSGVRLEDVTHVAIARSPNANLLRKIRYSLAHPVNSAGAILEHARRRQRTTDSIEALPEICGVDPERARFEIVPVEHHLAHVASAYYLSPYDQVTAAMSYDASGDFVSLMAARCEGSRIEVLDRVALPHSLGFFYTALCQLIGFDRFGEEYKVMGLAAYGEDRFQEALDGVVQTLENGWFRLTPGYFGMHDGGVSGATGDQAEVLIGTLFTQGLTRLLGPARGRDAPITQREMDIAQSTQARFEAIALHCFRRLEQLVPSPRLVMAGGCALNGVMNARIARDTGFEEFFLQPAASDDGTCVGAAYHVWHDVLNRPERFEMKHAFWGPEYPAERLRKVAEGSGFPLARYEGDELSRVIAGHIASGKVVGWFQGRSEWGPRALGNRCILADPARPDIKDLINQKIKRRESFRPFAPSVLKERVPDYFEQSLESPFMMHVVKLRPEWRNRLPGITHVDGTGRLQSVSREFNARYYDLIREFERQTGVGAVLNTSFNENEPIVDTPEQALDCFQRTDVDILCLGDYVLSKTAA